MQKNIKIYGIIIVAVMLLSACRTEQDSKEDDMKQYKLAAQLSVPSTEEMEEIYPISSYNHELMKEKGLTKTDEFNEKYLYLQALYRANLESYLS